MGRREERDIMHAQDSDWCGALVKTCIPRRNSHAWMRVRCRDEFRPEWKPSYADPNATVYVVAGNTGACACFFPLHVCAPTTARPAVARARTQLKEERVSRVRRRRRVGH